LRRGRPTGLEPRAALLTGARAPHELAALRVRDFRADLQTISIADGKTGARDVVLTREGVRWFSELVAGRAPDELLLPRDDGSAWNKSVHARDMKEAVKRAKLPKGTTLYSCRRRALDLRGERSGCNACVRWLLI